ncbi:hypothetical protein [Jannaschia marina]|uniref:hypothetical protein n=1 Tax=Jannaschia marina TaxID=2741674 RepID=UPI0015CB760F|nr:hypothetical protein [Jannaschia marina]
MKARLRLLAPLLLCALGLPVLAQQTVVRSGEHGGFTRLVFPAAANRSWTVTPNGDEALIDFGSGVTGLDLSQVFDRIPRDRISAIAFADGVLRLDLACACPVNVTQIGSGHVVIDVSDPAPGASAPPPAPAVRLAALPLRLIPRNLALPVLDVARRQADVADPPSREIAAIPPPQILRHPLGTVPLLPAPDGAGRTRRIGPACPLETLAAEMLMADPEIALADLETSRRALLAGDDRLAPRAVLSLADTYLRLGWGAEAAMILRSHPRPDPDRTRLAALLDGVPAGRAPRLDPACGPATALLAILDGVSIDDWARSDAAEFAAFADALAPARWHDLGDRLKTGFAAIDRSDVLLGIGALTHATSDADLATEATGTDLAAVLAVTQLLESTSTPRAADIDNALALRPSVPPGPERAALDAALMTALVRGSRPALLTELVARDYFPAADVLTRAMAELPREDVLDLAVRLRPALAPSDPLRRRLRDLFLDVGLTETARGFARPDPLPEPRAVDDPVVARDPWLARDLATLVATPEAEWTARHRMADAILARNAAVLPSTDLAAADSLLLESRTLADRARALLDTPAPPTP